MSKHFELIAIGAGSGGLSVVERAAKYGAKCAVVESGDMGGTCVNRGCVPKKVMWYGANLAHSLHHAADYGFDVTAGKLDWKKLVANKLGKGSLPGSAGCSVGPSPPARMTSFMTIQPFRQAVECSST